MIVLNNRFETPKGERLATRHLAKDQLLAAAPETHALIPGEPLDLASLLVPTRADGDAKAAPTADAYLRAITAEGAGGPALGGPPDVVRIEGWSFLGWGRPDEETMEKRTRALDTALRSAFPDRRYVLVWDLDAERKTSALVADKWHFGTVRVHRTLDAARGAIANVAVSAEELHDPERIASREGLMSLLLALPFAEKLRRLAHLAARGDTGTPITSRPATLAADAILVDLAHEQLAILHHGWRAGATGRSVERAMPLLAQLVKHFDEGVSGELETQVVRLVARLGFFVSSQVRGWEYLPPLLFARRAPLVRKVARRLLDTLITRALCGPDPESPEGRERRKVVRAVLADTEKRLLRRYRTARKEGETFASQAEYAREILLRPVAREGVTTDAELLAAPGARVLSRAAHDAIRARDDDHARRRRGMMATASAARGALLLPDRCAEMVARATPRARIAPVRVEAPARIAAAPPAEAWMDDLPREQRATR
ncbi:MAG: hypothetical protein QM820_35010 [Minicystis sp.]